MKSALQLLIAAVMLSSVSAEESVPSFRQDIMPILFRAGCNAGTCHGAAQGKDGFMLSLFGYDAKGDYYRMVNEMIGRRINYAVPEESLLLKKAIGAVPHTGGELFTADSEYYKTMHRWISAGAPDDKADVPESIGIELAEDRFTFEGDVKHAQLNVTATSDDGKQRDVTTLARFHSNNTSVATIDENGKITSTGPGATHVFARFSRFTVGAETIVLPPADDFTWSDPPANNYIDELVFDRLEKLRVNPSELADDETFLRRVTLDLTGRPPTTDEYHAFMADGSADKRSKKIDALLEGDGFTDLWTAIWGEQLRVIGGNYAPVGTHVKAADAFMEWIRSQIDSGRPLNEFVAEMVAASGSNLTNGPSNLYTMLVHAPQINPKALAADFSQVFLGIQIQCAECHNHPFDRWTQDDYYSFVSFFQGMKRKPGVEVRERRIFFDTTSEPAKHLLDGRPMPARVLGAIEPVTAESGDPRVDLAAWLTSPENEHFAKNLANRIWAQTIGRGVIEPIDDIRVSNPPSNGPLMDALSEKLVASNFSLRELVRQICNSRVYQLSSAPNPSNQLDTTQFSHTYMTRLRADVLVDSIVAATGAPRNFSNFPEGTKAIEFYPRENGDTNKIHFGDRFFEIFGRSGRSSISSTETKKDPTLPQVLHLTVGEIVNPRVSFNYKLKEMVEAADDPVSLLEEIYIRILSRKPSSSEREGLLALIGDSPKDTQIYEDIVWSLLNSSEFSFKL